MSNKQRWPATTARKVADALAAELTPRCERIEIAGSLRRGKADVGDIEILYVPRIGQVRVPGELFPRQGSLTDELLEQWLAKRVLVMQKGRITAELEATALNDRALISERMGF